MYLNIARFSMSYWIMDFRQRCAGARPYRLARTIAFLVSKICCSVWIAFRFKPPNLEQISKFAFQPRKSSKIGQDCKGIINCKFSLDVVQLFYSSLVISPWEMIAKVDSWHFSYSLKTPKPFLIKIYDSVPFILSDFSEKKLLVAVST